MMHESQRQTADPSISLCEVGEKLGAAIVATAEYQAFAEADRRFRRDAQARELLGKYQEAQQTVQLMQQLRNDGTEEARRLEDLQKTLEANKTLTSYFDAQQKLVALLTELNQFISERLNVDFAGLTKPRTGCCG
jgi:cell fate (sporulation/competence/biofilm development) regulator YlbF (YheA/YmcA/DUF963 family)